MNFYQNSILAFSPIALLVLGKNYDLVACSERGNCDAVDCGSEVMGKRQTMTGLFESLVHVIPVNRV